MKAELADGSIVVLEKGCDCITHSEPHWLHMDALDKARNKELLDDGYLGGHLIEEKLRLDRKIEAMNRLKIVRLIQED